MKNDRLLEELSKINNELTNAKREQSRLSHEKDVLLAELREQKALRERLIAVLAHDIRGPLGNLNSLLDLAISGELTGNDLHHSLLGMKFSTDSAFNLLQSILDWVGGSLKNLPSAVERVDVTPLVSAVLAWMEPLARAKSITLRASTMPDLVILAVPGSCEVILRNLVANAIKFSPDGSEVSIGVVRLPDRPEIRITVTDQGTGISPDILKKLGAHEPVKGSKGTAGESGSGLGLFFSRDLAERMGSRLEIETIPGQGSGISLVLPLA